MRTKRLINIFLIIFFAILSFFWLYQYNNKEIDNLNTEHSIATKISKNSLLKSERVIFLRVVDGDTILITDKQNKIQRVRIKGINTPESMNVNGRVKECFGYEAKEKAKEIFSKNKNLILLFDPNSNKYDKYDRLLAYIILENGEDYGEKMIKEGYAYEYTYHGRFYQNQKKYKIAQKYAEKHKKGLWRDGVCNF